MNEKIYLEAKVKKIDGDIKKAIKKAGIQYPHPSLAFFKATYAKFEEANKNNVILAESVKNDVPYLVGCQMNKNHYRQGYLMGEIIDAYVTEENEIEIIFTFHKSVYKNDYKEALDLMKKGKLTVSFELRVNKEDVEVVENGAKKIKKAFFDGVGLLFGVAPAYPNAFVLETALQQIENLLNTEDKQLCFASVKNIASKWAKIGQLLEETIIENNKGENEMDKKTNDALLAKQKEIIVSEFGEDAVRDWSDEDFLNEEKIQALRDSFTKENEEATKKPTQEQNKEKAESEEEIKEEAQTTVIERETVKKEVVEYDDEKNTEAIKTETETVVKRDGKEVVKEKTTEEVVFTYAEVEAIKAEYEAKLVAKQEEISFLKDNAKKIVEIRNEMGEFVANFTDDELFDETKMKIAKLEKENAELKQTKTLTIASEETEEEINEEAVIDEDLQTKVEDKETEEEPEVDTKEIMANYLKNRYSKV